MTQRARTPIAAAVRVPGSSANLGAGFDCVGLAVDRFLDASFEPGGDALIVERADGHPTGDDLVAISFERALAARGMSTHGLLRVRTEIPMGSGLGSSAAALVAGTALGIAAAGEPVEARSAFEPATAEEGHGDNTGPSAYGGLVGVVGEAGRFRALPLDLSPALGFAFAAPPTRLATRAARAALPASVTHKTATASLARVVALIRGLATGDVDLLREGFRDELHAPYRMSQIPGSNDALEAGLAAGAWAVTVSGAGSGLLAVCPPADADRIARALADGFGRRHDVAQVKAFALHPETLGVRPLTWSDAAVPAGRE